MQYRTDPRSGQQLSALGFGLMRLPRGLTGIDQEQTTALVAQARAGGVNYFDTAYVYPGSEAALGRALQALGQRSQIYLASKLPHQQCQTPADFDRIFQEQLTRLQTDYLDYYLIHNLPTPALWQRLVDLGIADWLNARQTGGQIRQVGFSFHGKQADFLELLTAWDWDFCQIQYNYLDTHYQAGQVGLRAAAQRNIAVIIMEPLRGGKLAGGLPAQAQAMFQAAEPTTSMAAWGLRWIWDQPEPTVVLSGMNNSNQLADNLVTAAAAGVGNLSAEQRQLFSDVQAVIRASYKIPCTGCNYCMPCPHGVNIPDCFAAYNTRAAQGLVAGFTQYMTSITPYAPARYSGPGRCVSCGRCERKCPQQLPVMADLVEVKKHMEPAWTRPLLAIARRVMK